MAADAFEGAGVRLLLLRKKNSKRSAEASAEYVQRYYSKRVETVGR